MLSAVSSPTLMVSQYSASKILQPHDETPATGNDSNLQWIVSSPEPNSNSHMYVAWTLSTA